MTKLISLTQRIILDIMIVLQRERNSGVFLMNKYAFDERYPALLTPEHVWLLSEIHELRGRCQVLLQNHPNETARFIGEAKAESIQALCRMSGFSLSNERMIKLTMDKTIPSSRNEQEVAGYRDAMRYIDQNQAYLSVCPRSIQQIYQVLHTFVSIHSDSQYRSTEACPIDILRGISFRGTARADLPDGSTDVTAKSHIFPLQVIPLWFLLTAFFRSFYLIFVVSSVSSIQYPLAFMSKVPEGCSRVLLKLPYSLCT